MAQPEVRRFSFWESYTSLTLISLDIRGSGYDLVEVGIAYPSLNGGMG